MTEDHNSEDSTESQATGGLLLLGILMMGVAMLLQGFGFEGSVNVVAGAGFFAGSTIIMFSVLSLTWGGFRAEYGQGSEDSAGDAYQVVCGGRTYSAPYVDREKAEDRAEELENTHTDSRFHVRALPNSGSDREDCTGGRERRLVLDESDQRKLLAGLAHGAGHYEDRREPEEADKFWRVRDELVDLMGPTRGPWDDLVLLRRAGASRGDHDE